MGRDVRWGRITVLACGYAVLFWLGNVGGTWMAHWLGFDPAHVGSVSGQRALLGGLVVYAVLLAIPFVPGMEISLALFALFGSAAAIPIYLATVSALIAAFLIGRMVPAGALSRLFKLTGLRRAGELVDRLAPLDAQARLAALIEGAPPRYVPFLLEHRYAAVAIAFNLPGNALLGGGGGIALLAGLSRLFTIRGFVLAVLLAVLPVPLATILGAKWIW